MRDPLEERADERRAGLGHDPRVDLLLASRPVPSRRVGFFVVMSLVPLLLLAGGALAPGLLARARAAARTATSVPGLAERVAAGEGGESAEPRRVSPQELAEMQRSWEGSASFSPRQDRVDAETHEQVRTFHGFGLQVDTSAPGATVLVNGEEKGTTPLLTTVECRPGDEVRVIARAGGASARAVTRCREDTLVKLSLRLTAAAAGSRRSAASSPPP